MPRTQPVVWVRALTVFVACGLLLAAWKWAPTPSFQDFSAWLAPHRHAWYALPLVVVAFVTLGLVMVPVVLLIAATGVAFGPWLGPPYAMAGCLASASTGFAIGRWMGVRRVEALAGERMTRVTRTVKRNGILAVFLVRKVPAPFTLANIVVGASSVRYRDFLVGTVLGMGAFVVALAGFGSQAIQALYRPSPAALVGAAMVVGVPLAAALLINRALRTRPV